MMYFLSGLPRSGSTLLAALLNQRNDTYVTATDTLPVAMGNVMAKKMPLADKYVALRKLIPASDNAVYVSKARAWMDPNIMATMGAVFDKPVKVIAPVRSPRECLASFAALKKPEDLDAWIKDSVLANNVRWAYNALVFSMKAFPGQIHLVEYDKLVADPQHELNKVAGFLDVKKFNHTFNNIASPVEQDWGVKGLHELRTTVAKGDTDYKSVLGVHWDKLAGLSFWKEPAWQNK
jgi:sulfotransferase